MTTFEQLQAHLISGKVTQVTPDWSVRHPAPVARCADGSTMSVQASRTHYCTPQDDTGPYTHVEVWYCGSPPGWAEYGDGSDPYGYLPIELVVAEIDRRGGFVHNSDALC